MQIAVYNTAGQVVDHIEIRDDVFGVPPNIPLMHQAVVRQLANARVGTADTKTRGEVSGGGRKPWRQKGTGRARQGSIRAPHWKGGGVVWGPHPRDYSQDMPKKMRRLALRCALSTKVAEQHLVVLDSLRLERPRTKDMVAILRNLGLAAKVLIALPEVDQNIVLSARNIPGVETLPARMLNIVDVLKHDYLVMPVAAVRQVEAWLAPERPAAAGALETGAPEEESA